MEEALLDKEVLCIIDSRGIQNFIFHSNSMADTVGANNLLQHILEDAFVYAAAHVSPPLSPEEYVLPTSDVNAPIPYFEDQKVKAQVITCAAGNMITIFRTGALCRDIVRKISRYYVDNVYAQPISSAYVEKTEDNQQDIKKLYKRLSEVKADFADSHPVGVLPIVRAEKNTGEPVEAIDPVTGEELSRVTLIRRAEFARMNSPLSAVNVSTYTAGDGREYYAVAHLDGNNMGFAISVLMRRASSYQEDIRLRRMIDTGISQGSAAAVDHALHDVKATLNLTDEEFDRAIRIVHHGGDDLNVIADPRVIFLFTECYVKRLKEVPVFDLDDFCFRMSVCAGIAFVHKDVPFIDAFSIADGCCSNAKAEAKKPENAVNGAIGNWVDFQFVYADSPQTGISDRQTAFTTPDGIRLMRRPYCMDEEMAHTPKSYQAFRERAIRFCELHLPQESREQILQAYDFGRRDITVVSDLLTAAGYPISERCGQPLVRQDDGFYAMWYDAMEVGELFLKKENFQ